MPPFHKIGGFPFPPKHFLANFFRNFFPKGRLTFCCIFGAENYVFLGRTFFYFYSAKNYGGKGRFSLSKWGGGVLCCMLSIIARSLYSACTPLLTAISSLLRHTTRTKRASNLGKKGQNLIFICLILSHLGDLGDNKRQNTNIFLKCGVGGALLDCFRCGVPSCLPVAGGQAFEACPLLSWCVPSLSSALSLCLCCVMLEYGSISRFKVVFGVVYGFGVGLCCLRALRGLCGFCARVELGGLKACGVFASIYPFICLPLCPCFSLCLSSRLCLYCSLLVLLSCLCCFLFPFGIYAKRKGAKVYPLRPLFVCCGLLYLVAALYSSYSSGVSPFIS